MPIPFSANGPYYVGSDSRIAQLESQRAVNCRLALLLSKAQFWHADGSQSEIYETLSGFLNLSIDDLLAELRNGPAMPAYSMEDLVEAHTRLSTLEHQREGFAAFSESKKMPEEFRDMFALLMSTLSGPLEQQIEYSRRECTAIQSALEKAGMDVPAGLFGSAPAAPWGNKYPPLDVPCITHVPGECDGRETSCRFDMNLPDGGGMV